MSKVLQLIRTDLPTAKAQVVMFRTIEMCLITALKQKGKDFPRDTSGQLLKREETRELLTQELAREFRRKNMGNCIAVVGKELNLAVKFQQKSMMQCMMHGDHVVTVYQPPGLNIPYVSHSLYQDLDLSQDYSVEVTPIWKQLPGQSQKTEETDEYLKEIDIPGVIKHALEQQLEKYVSEKKGGEFDPVEFPAMAASFLSRDLSQNDEIRDKIYGWNFVSGGIGKPGSSGNSISCTVDKLPLLTREVREKEGVDTKCYREYNVNYSFEGKSTNNLKVIVFRVGRARENRLKKGVKDFYEAGPKEWFSVNTVHKILFMILGFLFLYSRLGCTEQVETTPEAPSSGMLFEEETKQMTIMETFCSDKNYYMFTVAISFLFLTAIKMIFGKLQKKRAANQRAAAAAAAEAKKND